jgi:hypothetical protein
MIASRGWREINYEHIKYLSLSLSLESREGEVMFFFDKPARQQRSKHRATTTTKKLAKRAIRFFN